MITRKVAPALAAGCTVVIKPAELTPLTALAAAELAQRAGIPAGVLNILCADADNSIAIGKLLCESPIVRHISFTGSTEVGRILMAQSAPTIKKMSLELRCQRTPIFNGVLALLGAIKGSWCPPQ